MDVTKESADRRKRWFEEKSPVGKSAEELKSEHEYFKRRVTAGLSKADTKNFASSKQELDKQISDVTGGQNHLGAVEAVQESEKATKTHDRYRKDRGRGGKKAKRIANQMQHGLSSFAQFVSAFDGILEKVASAGAPFGEVGYQTLSILLIIITTKTKNDDRIIKCLDDIRRALPRLDVWEDIYPTDEMRDLVSSAYLQVIEFSRKASEYFARFWLRFYLAINPAATTNFEDMATGLSQILAEINAEALFGLHGRSKSIQQTADQLKEDAEQAKLDRAKLLLQGEKAAETNNQLRSQNQVLQEQVKELKREIEERTREDQRRERQQDLRMLAAFETLLRVDAKLAGATQFSAVKAILMKVFPNTGRFSPRIAYTGYTQLHKQSFMEMPEYQAWINHPLSALLCLSGSTETHGKKHQTTHSWLSPAAIYVAETISADPAAKLAFFSCHPRLENEHVPGHAMLSSLILQVLQWEPRVLREKDAEFRRILEEQSRAGHTRLSKEHALVELLRAVLVEVHRQLPEGTTIFLVIDRLDCCSTTITPLADELTRLVMLSGEGGSPRVKIMFVVETSGNNGRWFHGHLPEHLCDPDRLLAMKLDQRRLTSLETAVYPRPSVWSGQ
ncbi:hypothetical protein QBC43DRAFT_326896 [Cladorrhinum sp. PSN259]|nr:hypothetical protein QBC43DRAFT_326896 [Cladorrhinum sp. PSN259]